MWYLSSQTRDRISIPCIGRQVPNHWTTREFPAHGCFFNIPQQRLIVQHQRRIQWKLFDERPNQRREYWTRSIKWYILTHVFNTLDGCRWMAEKGAEPALQDWYLIGTSLVVQWLRLRAASAGGDPTCHVAQPKDLNFLQFIFKDWHLLAVP